MILTTPDINLNPAATDAFIAWLTQQSTKVNSPLAADISAGATTLTVTVANWQPAINSMIGVENEIMLVTAKSGSTLTVTRGRATTTAVAHLAGALVRELRYQTKEEAAAGLMKQFLKQLLVNDPTLNAPVLAAQATRDAAIEAGVV